LSLQKHETKHIQDIIKRKLTKTELQIIAAEWSEHCSYKSSKKHLKMLPTTGRSVILEKGYDSGVLDVGVGSGASSRLWAPKAKEFHGVDIGNGIYRATKTLANSVKNPIISHSDLHHLPYPDESFDVIVSNGVLHHTPNTKNALKSIYPKLKKGGLIIFYIYKVKAPLREFSDDYIRNLLSNLSPEEAFEKTKSITKLAESLHNQQIRIIIPEDVPLLGFKKGEYDLQRFIYQNIFKLFWKKSMGFYESNMENFDWYYPKYSWRHTEQEIKDWCTEFNLTPKLIKENYSGFTCHAFRE